MPFELPCSPAAALTVHAGCALRYHAEARSRIHLLVLPSPELAGCVLDESLSHDRGETMERVADPHGNIVLSTWLLPGMNEIRHAAILRVPPPAPPRQVGGKQSHGQPFHLVRYTLPSRYCESDKLVSFAARRFGRTARTRSAVQEICDWTHRNIEYRHGSGDATLSAVEAMRRGHGVCRDFAHVMIALCRALDIPARYAAGHIPLVGNPLPGSDIGIDFHAFVEVHLDGRWQVFDPRHNRPGHIHLKLAHGMDAVDTAIATFHGPVSPAGFDVWAYAAEACGLRHVVPAPVSNHPRFIAARPAQSR